MAGSIHDDIVIMSGVHVFILSVDVPASTSIAYSIL